MSILFNRWFWMATLAVALFVASAGWAKTFESYRETKTAYKALMDNYEATQAAFEERDTELRQIEAQLTERRKVIYVSKDDCAGSRMPDDILVSLRGTSAENP